MRLAIFSSLVSRSAARAPLQSLRAVSALIMLTGVMGQGCQGTVVEPPQPPPSEECECGFHLELVCTPCDEGNMCEEQCVPDAVCPPGSVEQTVCADGGYGGGVGGYGEPMPYPDPSCWTECVPFPQPVCPPGTFEQTVCGGSSSTGVGGSGGGVSSTSSTGVGGSGGGVGSGSGGGVSSTSSSGGYGGSGGYEEPMPYPPPPPDGSWCWTECVPFPEPVCPPGTFEQTVCSGEEGTGTGGAGGGYGTGGAGGGYGTGGAGGGYGTGSTGAYGEPTPYPVPACWTECVPFPEPEPACPPGAFEQWVCEGGGGEGGYGEEPYCRLECVFE